MTYNLAIYTVQTTNNKKETKMKRRVITFDENYHEHPTMADRDKGYGMDTKKLQTIESTLDYALERHSKVMGFRVDLSMDQSTDNGIYRKTMSEVVRHLQNHKLSPLYVGVREVNPSTGNTHYHNIILVDASRSQNPYGHLSYINEKWQKNCEDAGCRGTVDYCDKSENMTNPHTEYIMHRGNKEEYDEFFRRSTYLAKIDTKPNDSQRELFSSRLD